MAASATERIVVQTSAQEKCAILSKANRLGLSISELMRRGASTYETDDTDQALNNLADRVIAISNRLDNSLHEVLIFVDESNKRIEQMEAAAKARKAQWEKEASSC
ncbi:hypothetical protein FHW67_001973 [Herbaspirillum sp. Sphag1AN]|uniref:hypothetical protein n=1 Tax=unclassified Herbaspirillum TaxID=2624150 RepID=UPI001616F1E2|nr:MULTISPECIES: hypothetical protein [unclassified Herbaspirillum]MBB3212690.1 hypothetical protein [Herbaspirillum sp. Sphag1AN]MBB3245887.1 hypothetical protein [Herbaspirillum sp. Sphag64]